jgi:hypothetical protein
MPRKDLRLPPDIGTSLSAAPMTDDLIDRIAKEVAAQVSAHVETMYPDAAGAVAWDSCKRSIQGVIRNNIAAASRNAENGTIEDWLKTVRATRLKLMAHFRNSTSHNQEASGD